MCVRLNSAVCHRTPLQARVVDPASLQMGDMGSAGQCCGYPRIIAVPPILKQAHGFYAHALKHNVHDGMSFYCW
jgi:hypothetical protein